MSRCSGNRRANSFRSSFQSSGEDHPVFFQRKPLSSSGALKINQPNDAYEQEADAIADKIMQTKQVNNFSSSLRVQRKCAHCEEEEGLQRKASHNEGRPIDSSLERFIGNLPGSGQSLPTALRDFYEPRFGHDFSHVKIHTGTHAAQSAESIDALAYTSGNNIVFNTDQYAPETDSGKRLLAHELTHVVQQQSVPMRSIMRQPKKKKKSNSEIIEAIKKNPLFKKLPKFAQDKIIEELESAPETIVQKVAEEVIDLLNIDSELKKGLKKAVEAIIAKFKGKPKKFSPCDVPGFHPGGSSKFKGMCCTESTEREEVCCVPELMNQNERRCCPKNTIVFEGKCIDPKDLPPLPKPKCPDGREPTFSGKCCEPDQISIGTQCIDKPIDPPPPPPQPVPVVEKVSAITFKKDAPQTWFAPSASFNASLTTEGKEAFNELVTFLKKDSSASLQIQGHASSEKPKGDPDYNQRLTDRRVKLIASELQKKGIDSTRLKNMPDDAGTAGCVELSFGVLSCGDSQAQSSVEASDRNVTVKAFEIK